MPGNDNDETEKQQTEEFLQLVLSTLSPSGIVQNHRTDLSALTKLNLPGCGLSSLPSSLPELCPNLSILFMPKNHMKELPSVIGKCPKLQVSCVICLELYFVKYWAWRNLLKRRYTFVYSHSLFLWMFTSPQTASLIIDGILQRQWHDIYCARGLATTDAMVDFNRQSNYSTSRYHWTVYEITKAHAKRKSHQGPARDHFGLYQSRIDSIGVQSVGGGACT